MDSVGVPIFKNPGSGEKCGGADTWSGIDIRFVACFKYSCGIVRARREEEKASVALVCGIGAEVFPKKGGSYDGGGRFLDIFGIVAVRRELRRSFNFSGRASKRPCIRISRAPAHLSFHLR